MANGVACVLDAYSGTSVPENDAYFAASVKVRRRRPMT
jgi:hypothetical protein